MSHHATNWAVQQRGLKPATKIVLWHLCDRHNPDYGCFPSQKQLAYDTEMSESALNVHLLKLEAAGLVRRVQSRDQQTNRQMRTRYILGFEAGFIQEPTPESGVGIVGTEKEHTCEPTPESGDGSDSGFEAKPTPDFGQSRLRNPESKYNPVREPLREPVKEEEDARECASPISDEFFSKVLAAVGIDPNRLHGLPGWWQGDAPRRHIGRWQRDLGLSESAILEVAAETRLKHAEPPDGPKGLDRAMARRAATDRAVSKKPAGGKPSAPPPSVKDKAAFYANLVNGDGFLPASSINNSIRDAMLAHGLVTAERLRERGVR